MWKKNIISIRHGRKEEPGPDVLIMFLFGFFLNIKMQSIRSTMWNFPKYEHKAKRKEKKRIKDKQHKYEHTKKKKQ